MTPLLVFFGSRTIVLLGILFSTYLSPNPGLPPIDKIDIGVLFHWDAGWYRGIVESGYSWADDGQSHNVIFFPLYPAISKALHTVTGMPIPLSMILISNLTFFFSLILLYQYLLQEFDKDTAIWSIIFISLFPTSMFFSAAYPESLSLFFSVAVFYFLSKDKPLTASIMSGIATATRSPLVLLAIPIFLYLVKKYKPSISYVAYSILCLVLSISGLLAYMAYLYYKFSDPLVFVKGYEAWKAFNPGGEESLIKILSFAPVVQDLKWNLFKLSARTFDAPFFIVFLVLSTWGLLKYRTTLFVYSWGLIMFSYLSHAHFSLISMDRYLLLAFPSFILMAHLFKDHLLRTSVVSIFAVLLFMHSAWYAKWYWAG